MHIYTKSADVVACGVDIMLYTTVTYFLCGMMDLFPGALRGMGHSAVPMILSVIGTVGTRIVWIYLVFPYHRALDFLKSVSDKTILIPPACGFVRYPEAKIYINFPRT